MGDQLHRAVGYFCGCLPRFCLRLRHQMIAKRAPERAGIHGYAHHGAHLFRHSLATDLLRSGASFAEIGQLLRHRSTDSTRIYAKLDIEKLREPVLAGRCPMSRLRTALECYVGIRQGLGYKYHGPARRLSDFVTFMEARGAETITTALAMEWVTSIGRQPSWSIRLTDVRCFAQHLAHFDPLTEVPPRDAVAPPQRAKPYIYSDAEITALLACTVAAARQRPASLDISLIAVAGLRHSEALDLRRDDVDLDQGILTIRETKFGKSGWSRSMPRRSPFCRTMPRDATRISACRAVLILCRRAGRQIAAPICAPRLLATVATDRPSAEAAAQRSTDS